MTKANCVYARATRPNVNSNGKYSLLLLFCDSKVVLISHISKAFVILP